MVFSETFRLTTNKSQLVFRTKMDNAKRLRVARVIYTTASTSNYFLFIILSHWHRDSTFNGAPYTKLLTLPRTTLTEYDYEAYPNEWHVEIPSGGQVGNNKLEIYINNDPSNTDISPSNPVYIEFQYE